MHWDCNIVWQKLIPQAKKAQNNSNELCSFLWQLLYRQVKLCAPKARKVHAGWLHWVLLSEGFYHWSTALTSVMLQSWWLGQQYRRKEGKTILCKGGINNSNTQDWAKCANTNEEYVISWNWGREKGIMAPKPVRAGFQKQRRVFLRSRTVMWGSFGKQVGHVHHLHDHWCRLKLCSSWRFYHMSCSGWHCR